MEAEDIERLLRCFEQSLASTDHAISSIQKSQGSNVVNEDLRAAIYHIGTAQTFMETAWTMVKKK